MDLVDAVVTSDSHTVLLRPRPFAKSAGRLVLLPLLPQRTSIEPLPSEVWTRILHHVFTEYNQHMSNANTVTWRRDLLLVCKSLRVCSCLSFVSSQDC